MLHYYKMHPLLSIWLYIVNKGVHAYQICHDFHKNQAKSLRLYTI